jgi:hypothetical protein
VRVLVDDGWTDGLVENLSLGGMLLKLPGSAPSGERLAVQWVHPDDSVRMKVWGQVVRREGDARHLGLAFVKMTHETAERLKTCLLRKDAVSLAAVSM